MTDPTTTNELTALRAEVDAALAGAKDRFDHADAKYDPDVLALIRAAEQMRDRLFADMPPAWAELIEALTILAQHPTDPINPTHCDDDTLTVLADANSFDDAELDRLAVLGFGVTVNDAFSSFRFGSA